MTSAVIIDAVRTPIGRADSRRGYYRRVRSDDLAAACVRALMARNKVPPQRVDDVIFGTTQPVREQGLNIARQIALLAGLPATAAGTTVNRLCGSSLQAIHQAAHAIQAGAEDVQIVGGLEHMQHLPMEADLDVNPRLFRYTSPAALRMGITAEFMAHTYKIPRAAQDEFALESHRRAAAAQVAGEFRHEMIEVAGHDEAGRTMTVDRDQCVRPDTSMEAQAALPPVFVPHRGTVTAGNSSPLNDGAAALLMMSETTARDWGLTPLAKVRATAVAGVDPCLMGTGPIPATEKVLRRAGLTVADLDLIELNEAFAVQALACIQQLELPRDRVNVRGGALAIGHPLGASGARIATTLLHAMRDRGAQFGLATMCVGLGQGVATIFERC